MYTDTDIYTHMHTFTSLKEFNPWQMRRLGSTRKSWDRAGLRTARWSCRSSEQRQSRLFGDAGRPTVERRHRTFASLQIAVSFSECSSENPPQVNTTAVSDACLIFEARARMFVTALYCWSCVTAHLYVYWNTKVQFQSAKSSLDAFHIFP